MNKVFFNKEYSFDSEKDIDRAVIVSTKCENALEFEKDLRDYLIEWEVV